MDKINEKGEQSATIYQKIFKLIIGLSTPVILYIAYSFQVICIYAGIVTKNAILVSIPLVLVSLTIIIFIYRNRKRSNNYDKIMEQEIEKFIPIMYLGILCFTSSFYLNYFHDRPSVEDISKIQKNAAIIFEQNESDFDYLHAANSSQLQTLVQINSLMEQLLECEKTVKIYQGKGLTEEEKIELAKYVIQKKEELDTCMNDFRKIRPERVSVMNCILILTGSFFIYKSKNGMLKGDKL